MKQQLRIALAGNPNSGKTTLFNALTGANQFVGNWPGVTVEKKEGQLRGHDDVRVVDLPGIYSLSPYSLEEVVARDFLADGGADAIINIVDGSNLERNLYLTTQLLELGLPMVVAVNMMDVVTRAGDSVDPDRLAEALGCPVVGISALRGDGIPALQEAAVTAAREQTGKGRPIALPQVVAQALDAIETAAGSALNGDETRRRWLALKLFERDEKVAAPLALTSQQRAAIEAAIVDAEAQLDDDAESIVGNIRYEWIASIIEDCRTQRSRGKLSTSDKIDRIVTNRILALPIFAAVMFVVYFISVTTVGSWVTDWTNEELFGPGFHLFGIGAESYEEDAEAFARADVLKGAFEEAAEAAEIEPAGATTLVANATFYDEEGNVDEEVAVDHAAYLAAAAVEEPEPAAYGRWVPGIPVLAEQGLERIGVAGWLKDLVIDGIIAGVGAVIGFVPQMLVLFLFLAFLEACGYMARVAFVMDRIFRNVGLSGKSFIPMLISTGCAVPGIMATRTIENERDRRLTITTTSFMPCGAKLPIIALIAGALFGGAWWVAPSAYFVGIAAIVLSGIMLKKMRFFSGEVAPFIIELPSYRMPRPSGVLRSMWERGWSFIRRAGTIILLATIVIWFSSNYGFGEGGFGRVEGDQSLLGVIGGAVAWIFAPLGWGQWQPVVGAITGLIAKENVVGTFGVLYGGMEEVAENGWQIWPMMREAFTPLAAYSFLLFNLLCAPCFAAIGAIRREMSAGRWTLFAIGYQCAFAYAVSLIVYQLGMLVQGQPDPIGVAAAIILLAIAAFLLLRRQPQTETLRAIPQRS